MLAPLSLEYVETEEDLLIEENLKKKEKVLEQQLLEKELFENNKIRIAKGCYYYCCCYCCCYCYYYVYLYYY